MHRPGDVILTMVQFADTFEIKKRPALILFEEHGNTVVAGITSNPNMEGIELKKSEGAIKDSVIKLNYIFTISENMILKKLFSLGAEKRKSVFNALVNKLNALS